MRQYLFMLIHPMQRVWCAIDQGLMLAKAWFYDKAGVPAAMGGAVTRNDIRGVFTWTDSIVGNHEHAGTTIPCRESCVRRYQ